MAADDTVSWKEASVIGDRLHLPDDVINNTLKLLDDGNTIPFIARYRRECTNCLDADKIREIKNNCDYLRAVKKKVELALHTIKGLGKLNNELSSSLCTATHISEVEHLFAPFKPGAKTQLSERAKELGLEPMTQCVINNPAQANLYACIVPSKKGVQNLEEVKKGITAIIADMAAKHKDVVAKMRDIYDNRYVKLHSKQCATAKSSKTDKQDKIPPANKKGKAQKAAPQANPEKFHLYLDFEQSIKFIKPHQILAINRAENLKILTVKVIINDQLKGQVLSLCERLFASRCYNRFPDFHSLITHAIEDGYSRLMYPSMSRHIRSQLNKYAEKASIDVFASNLKQLLLTPPIRGQTIMGFDPGFSHGCKYAIINSAGSVVTHGICYALVRHNYAKQEEINKLVQQMVDHQCVLVAIGNGTACRESEALFSDLIKRKVFKPLNVQFCIVNESGASIYSASAQAKKEFPDLDINIIGAVSIGRRLQDPLSEYVKIDPESLGVGMYQHDINKVSLKHSLQEVVEECVSFVGVDINVCSQSLLCRVAGLGESKAKNILTHRDKHGAFINRKQLSLVKGLGKKTYDQCIGFIRIIPQSSHAIPQNLDCTPPLKKKRKLLNKIIPSKRAKMDDDNKENLLDMTDIHPESYEIAYKFLKLVDMSREDIGTIDGITKVKQFLQHHTIESLAKTLNTGIPTLTMIVKGLQQNVQYDMREEYEKPLFKTGLLTMDSLKPGAVLTGRVGNVTHFGAFTDIGVGHDGLIHNSCMNIHGRPQKLSVGNRVEVTVQNVDTGRKRIGLQLMKIL